MDMMFHRYGTAFELMDNMIDSGCFSGAVVKFCNQDTEEGLWQLYLHKVYDKSYSEFRSEVMKEAKSGKASRDSSMTREEFDATIAMSDRILDSLTKEDRLC